MIREVDGQVLVLDPALDRIHHLNPTASVIWRAWDGTADAPEIAAALAMAFDVEQHVALRDVIAMLEQMRALGLVTDPHGD